jgi:hypothetical protein
MELPDNCTKGIIEACTGPRWNREDEILKAIIVITIEALLLPICIAVMVIVIIRKIYLKVKQKKLRGKNTRRQSTRPLFCTNIAKKQGLPEEADLESAPVLTGDKENRTMIVVSDISYSTTCGLQSKDSQKCSPLWNKTDATTDNFTNELQGYEAERSENKCEENRPIYASTECFKQGMKKECPGSDLPNLVYYDLDPTYMYVNGVTMVRNPSYSPLEFGEYLEIDVSHQQNQKQNTTSETMKHDSQNLVQSKEVRMESNPSYIPTQPLEYQMVETEGGYYDYVKDRALFGLPPLSST